MRMRKFLRIYYVPGSLKPYHYEIVNFSSDKEMEDYLEEVSDDDLFHPSAILQVDEI